jgi:uncharacterized protein
VVAPLPRRAFLGARLPADAEAFSAAGMRVDGVVTGSMAAAAGVASGDRVTAIADAPVRSLAELAAALRRAGAGARAELAFARGAERVVREVAVVTWPREHLDGQEVDYGVLEVPGARLRTIVTRPARAAPRAAVLVLQGIACESIDGGGGPLVELIHGWARAGILTMRVDKRGVGDSEGGPCPELDFQTEANDARAALAAFDQLAAGLPRYLFGHSVGGMIAALLAAERPVGGVLVYGTSTARWLDCVAASTARQQGLHGLGPEAIAENLAALRDRVRRLGLNGRSPDYHRQLDAVALEDAWARVQAPRVLVLRGEHDWVVGAAEQARIAEVAPGRVEVADLPGLDHLLGWHPDRQTSLREYGNGRFDPAVVDRTLAWMLVSSRS